MLPPGMESDCQICRRRPKSQGGSGSCPFSASVRLAYRGGGGKATSNCPEFSDTEYVPPAAAREARNHPQEAALF